MRPPPPPIPVIYAPDLSDFDREYAVSVFGGFPQINYAEAERTLMRKCLLAGFSDIGPAAILTLEIKLMKDIENAEPRETASA